MSRPTCDYCGDLGWTVERYGRVTHKEACPHRVDPWTQADPQIAEMVAELEARLRAAEEFAKSFIHWIENDAPAEWDGGNLGYDMGGFYSMAQEVLGRGNTP